VKNQKGYKQIKKIKKRKVKSNNYLYNIQNFIQWQEKDFLQF
jgi:hypothetical protein